MPSDLLTPKAIVAPGALLSPIPCSDLPVHQGLNSTPTPSMNIPIACLAVHGKVIKDSDALPDLTNALDDVDPEV